MENIRRFVVAHLWWLVLAIALAMLITHSLGVRRVVVDNTSLLLLGIVLLSPFVAAIKKVKIGDFEAEIQPDEAKRVAQQAAKSLPLQVPGDSEPTETSETAAAIHRLAQTDPVVALAKLRIELESRLRRIEQRLHPDSRPPNKPPTLTRVIRDLASHAVFEVEFGASVRDVISICNRAIHGEDIRDVDARLIIDTGTELLEVLERTTRYYAVTHPIEATVITPQERDEVSAARYRLTTVVPLVESPERHVYVLTQEELDAFFETYSEVAEFAVELKRIE